MTHAPRYSDGQQLIIQTLSAHGAPMTVRQIADQTGHAGTRSLTRCMTALVESRAARICGQVRAHDSQKRNLYELVTPQADNQVPPRTAPAYQPFNGVDWSHSIARPGCQDALLHPSRRGDVRVMPRTDIGLRPAGR